METQQMIPKKKDPKYNNSPEYNQMYYAKRKSEILSALKTKCKCELCDRVVSYQRMNGHQKTALCMSGRKSIS